MIIFIFDSKVTTNKHDKSKSSCLNHKSLFSSLLDFLDMSDTVGLRDILCRYRNLCPEEEDYERATDYVTFLDGEESRLRGLIANLRFNADFERVFFSCQLTSCIYLLKIWNKKSKRASKAWKKVLRRRGNTGKNTSAK